MNWFSDWVDIDSNTEAPNNGTHEAVVVYNEYDAIVTIPFSTDSFIFVS